MKQKTVGILTFNRALNYGAVLQAYALKAVCENLGYSVCVINYWRESKSQTVSKIRTGINLKKVLKSAKKMSNVTFLKQKQEAFEQFRKQRLNESAKCNNSDQVNALGLDAYIVGSDQIWNYNITGKQFDPVYFGNLRDDVLKVIYAGSAHDTPFPLKEEKEFTDLLLRSKAAISIREQKLADYVETLTGIRYPTVLDPTLLAGRELLDPLTVGYEKEKEPYILIYQIDANPYSDISVKTLEKRFGCKTYTMTVPRIGSMHGRRGTAGPEEFLSLLKNAEMIVTNSFHGIALSLLYEKQFFVYEHDGVMTRIDGLLNAVGLDDRKVRLVSDIDTSIKIDYTEVNHSLSYLRKDSMDYLEDALQGKQFGIRIEQTHVYKLPFMRERRKQECSGCSACVEVCPVNAITMKANEEGFLYPRIDEKQCIHCGLCDRVCGFVPKQITDQGYEKPYAFGIKHRDEQTRLTSRSGAAFIAFSDLILKKGGTVYGAAFSDHFKVEHIRAETAEERDRMKNAKYVQSDPGHTFKQVEYDLKEGRSVLYSGTPCQISGLLTYLKAKNTDTNHLFTCDLVCHGTPSPAIWYKYVGYIEKKYKQRIQKANFRDKEFGWDSHCESFILEDGRKIVSRDYTDLFYDHIMFRPSCHNCHFANTKRVSDITLADFWGIEKNSETFNDNKGVSLVLINTPKGQVLMDEVQPDLEIIRCELTNCIQPTLVKPSSMSILRDDFWSDYRQMSFTSLLKKYTRPASRSKRIKRNLKYTMYHLHLRKHP